GSATSPEKRCAPSVSPMARPQTIAITSPCTNASPVSSRCGQKSGDAISWLERAAVSRGEVRATSPAYSYSACQASAIKAIRARMSNDWRTALLVTSSLRLPLPEPLLPRVEPHVDHRRDDQDEQDQRVHGLVVEVVVGEADLVTHAVARQNELGGEHPDEGIGDRELQPGEVVQGGVRQRDQEDRA